MTVTLTTTEMISRVRRMTQTASTNEKLSDTELVQIMDETIQSKLWPVLRRTWQDWCIASNRVVCGGSAPAGTDPGLVRIPSRASASTIVSVAIVLPQGDIPLTNIDSLQAGLSGQLSGGNAKTGTQPCAYTIVGDSLRVVPTPTAPTTLRVTYERRPSRLVRIDGGTMEACGRIASAVIAGGNLQVTLTGSVNAPVVGQLVDVVRSQPLQTAPIVDDMTITIAADPGFTMSSAVSETTPQQAQTAISAGDYLCFAGETCIFPLPEVWWPAFLSVASQDVLLECGYIGESNAMQPKIDAEIALAVQHCSNRARKQPPKVFNRNSGTRQGYWGARNGSGWSW